MGWLWNDLHHMFDNEDGSFPEICICGLSAEQVSAGYLFVREITDFVVGAPRFYNNEAKCEMGLDEVENPAQMVCEKKANPFHFMARSIRYAKGQVHELGVFILDNAIALDYEKGPIWGEQEIETLLQMIIKIKADSARAFIRLEDAVSADDLLLIEGALARLVNPREDD